MKCSEGSNDPGKVTGTARYRERVYSPEMLVKIARFGISQPRVLFNAWWLPRQGVELGDCSWIPGRIDLSLACRSSLSIGDRVFIPRTIEVMGYDDGRIIVGDDVCMDTGARLHVANEATLRIGDRVGVGPYNFLNAFDDLTIGDDTMLAPMISINCADHGVSRGCPMREQRGTYAPVIIGSTIARWASVPNSSSPCVPRLVWVPTVMARHTMPIQRNCAWVMLLRSG